WPFDVGGHRSGGSGQIPAIFGSLRASRCGTSVDGGRHRVRGANVDRPLDSGTALREGADPLNERPSAPTSRQAASLPCSRCKFCCVHALLPRVHALLLPRVSLRAIICHLPPRACGTLRWRPVL
ncbi:hypothetical protein T484DRAFT_1949992, partial [Baffinella frigidus]